MVLFVRPRSSEHVFHDAWAVGATKVPKVIEGVKDIMPQLQAVFKVGLAEPTSAQQSQKLLELQYW